MSARSATPAGARSDGRVVGEQPALERQPRRRDAPASTGSARSTRRCASTASMARSAARLTGQLGRERRRAARRARRSAPTLNFSPVISAASSRRRDSGSVLRVAELELRPRELEQLARAAKVPQRAQQLRDQLVAQFALAARCRAPRADGPPRSPGRAERLRAAELAQHFRAVARSSAARRARAARSDAAASGAPSLERRPGGAEQLLHDPLVARRRRLQQVRADHLARGALVREQPRRARVERPRGCRPAGPRGSPF